MDYLVIKINSFASGSVKLSLYKNVKETHKHGYK